MAVSASYTTSWGSQDRPKHIGVKMDILAGTLTFDSSYPAGGEDISAIVDTDSGGKFRDWQGFDVHSADGYTFQTDATNVKVKVYAPAPPIVYEEKHTIASNAVTLDYPAAAILNIASATQCMMLTEPTATLAANECQLSAAMAYDVRPTIDFHASTSGAVYVTYITQAWHEVWANRVASEAGTAATEVVTLDNNACFIESCLMAGVTGSNRPQFVRGGDAADGPDECEVDWTDAGAAGATTLTFNDTATGATTTYIKKPASGFLADRFLEDQDNTIAAGVSAAQTPARPILFQSICGQIPDYTNAAERDPHYLQMPNQDALGTTGEFYIDYGVRPAVGITQHIKLNDGTSDAVSLTYVYGVPEEIPNLRSLEVKNGTDLSNVVANFSARGSR